MPRTRGFRRAGSSPARRTNWLARVSTAHTAVTPGNTGTHFLIDVENSANEEAAYVDGTLVRIRGVICIDANFSISPPDDENMLVGAMISVSPDGASPGFDSAGYRLDEVLWTDMGGISSDWRDVAAAEAPDLRYGAVFHHLKFPVDVKAMRRLGDRSKVVLSVHNFSGVTSAVNLAFNYALRVLVKE